jgi:hypothetical protein
MLQIKFGTGGAASRCGYLRLRLRNTRGFTVPRKSSVKGDILKRM